MTEQTLALRRFESGDADRLWTVHEQALRDSGIEFIEDKADEDFTKIPERFLEPGGEFLVGVVTDEVVVMGDSVRDRTPVPRSDGCECTLSTKTGATETDCSWRLTPAPVLENAVN